jgi:hypothetical protein
VVTTCPWLHLDDDIGGKPAPRAANRWMALPSRVREGAALTSVERKAKWRVRIAFAFSFIFFIILLLGAYSVTGLGKFKETIAARETEHLAAMATQAANETGVAIDKLSDEFRPPVLSKDVASSTASRADLEALRSELKTAEAGATAFMPRYVALLRTEHDRIENYAHSPRADRDGVGRVLDDIDQRHAKITTFISTMLSARAEYYRAYENYLGVLVSNFGAYKVVNGEFIFTMQSTVDRYNVAAKAMTIAANRVAELEEERKKILQPQRETGHAGKEK